MSYLIYELYTSITLCLQTTFRDFINFGHPAIVRLHLQPNACSFNVGVYVADLDRWRAANLTQELLYWTQLNAQEDVYGSEKVPGGSQPPMMIALQNRHSVFDPLWHVRELGQYYDLSMACEGTRSV